MTPLETSGSSTSSSTTDVTTDSSTGPVSGSSEDGSSSSSSSSTGPDESSSSEESSTTEPVIPVECGNELAQEDEVCDGVDLRGEDCHTQGFDGGALTCSPSCNFVDISGCYQVRCGNNSIQVEGEESCDGLDLGGETCVSLGFDSGDLGCDQLCNFDFRSCVGCGNGEVENDEVCDVDDFAVNDVECTDIGFTSGVPGCTSECTYDTETCGLCGNGIIDGTEICDTLALAGTTCESLGFDGGDLGCTNTCRYDTAVCDTPTTLFATDVGYQGFSSLPPVLPCEDILATGTATNLADNAQLAVPIGFLFRFYGLNFTQVSLGSNGILAFGGTAGTGTVNATLPSNLPGGSTTNRILAPFWDNLNPGAAGDVIYQTVGNPGFRRFIAQWDVPFTSGNTLDLLQFQVVFHEVDDAIDICYVDTLNAVNAGNSGAGATVGLQRSATNPPAPAPPEAILFSFNQANVPNGLHLRFVPIPAAPPQ